jgi:gliding motility-associated-like protein
MNPPFATSIPYNFNNLPANGSPCSVTATFSADPTCTFTANYNAPPACAGCIINNLVANISAPDCNNNTYSVSGQVDFTSPPASGTMTVSTTCGGSQVFNAPFVSPLNFTINGLAANGNNCTVNVSFSANPACSQSLNYTAPVCNCFMNSININISACNPNNNTYDITGNVGFTSPPASGQLIIQNCNGQQAVFNPPFVSPINFTISGNTANGAPNCSVTAYFTANPACTITSPTFTQPASCGCTVNAGTYTANITGNSQNNYVLCANDQITINSNGDQIYPPDVNDPVIGYNPGLWYMIFSCPPNPLLEPNTDPCFVGSVIPSANMSDINDAALYFNSFPPGTFTNNTVYFVPITMYDVTQGYYSVTNYIGSCYDYGHVFAVQYLPAIVANGVEFCQTGAVTVTVSGGLPALSGGNFTASNLQPANAQFVNNTCGNNQTITINGLQNGQMYSFTITDGNGCSYNFSGGPFVGPVTANLTPAGPFCINDPNVNLTASIAGGTWSGTGIINAINGTFSPANAGVGTHTITYTPPGCANPSTMNITVTAILPSTITPAGPFCENDPAVQLQGATPGGTWSGQGITDPNNGTFSPAAAGPGVHQITYTITGSCGSNSQTNITVNPLPQIAFAGDNLSGCAPLTVNFTNNTIPQGTNCTWAISGINNNISNDCNGFSYVFQNPGCYDVSLQVTAQGCTSSQTLSNYICVFANPVADFTFSPTNATVLNPLIHFTNQSQGADSYFWDFAGLGNSTQTHPSFTFPDQEQTHVICLTASTVNGCIDDVCHNVIIYDEFLLYVPNSFTPTGDGINDIFLPIISGHDPNNYELMIFNRWGELIFQTNMSSKGWDGTHKGIMAKEDVYVWKIKARKKSNNEKKEFTGHVTLLK